MTKSKSSRSAIEIQIEPLRSVDARYCLDRYFAELMARFENGFDLKQGGAGDDFNMSLPDGAFIVARLDGAPVGCGGLKRLDDRAAEIKRVWCDPSARGMGIATALMARLENFAREAGYDVLRLDTNKALTEAHALYRKLGYRETRRYNDNPYSHHWFEKLL